MTEEIRVVDPDTGGEKGAKPYQFYTIPWEAMKEIAHVFYMGGRKYEPYNFHRGYRWSLSYDALHRHLGEFWNGTDWNTESFEDRETGEHTEFRVRHIAQAAWHCIVLTFFSIANKGTDDRPNHENDEPSQPVFAFREKDMDSVEWIDGV